MEEAGETYYWNEFHLIADDGNCATLVHEVTERGVEWRMFTLIEAANPLTAAEAASKRLGDSVNITGVQMGVTCVDESRVCFIEGEAPEGVELGDVARYFNAESGNEMIVVSWTGDEVEVYRGFTFPASAVAGAFGITSVPTNALRQLSGDDESSSGRSNLMLGMVAIVVMVLAGVGWWSCNARPRNSAPPKLARAQLTIGQSGELNAARYRIIGHAAVEVGRVGKRILRHEYVLSDDANEVLLTQGSEPDAGEWQLLTPVQTPRELTASKLAALKLGDSIEFDGAFAQVKEMFLSRVPSVEGTTPFAAGTSLYGVLARSPKETFLVRWSETNATFYHITILSAKTVLKSFK
jgi:hypothetical protein